MTGQQICLKWNSFQANILTSFETLWEEEGLVDVTLASDGECIRAHRVILSACSPFFKRLFQSNPCQHPVIILQDVHFSELEALLSFVYKGEVNIDQENLPALLRAAETLQIRGLSGASEQLKEKMGATKNPSSTPSRRSSLDGSPPYKRRRSDHQPPRSPVPPTTPAAPMPTAVSEHTRHPPSSSADSGEQLQQHKLEGRSCDADSPVPPLLSVEEGFEESGDGSLDLKAVHVADDTEQLKVFKNFPYPPFPCPFCDRAYTSWGFRRRHIKGVHTHSPRLSCKWCLQVLPSHSEWENHVISEHQLSQGDAHNGLLILEEAHMVLQIPNPTRLDAFVNMIQQSSEGGASSGSGHVKGSDS